MIDNNISTYSQHVIIITMNCPKMHLKCFQKYKTNYYVHILKRSGSLIKRNSWVLVSKNRSTKHLFASKISQIRVKIILYIYYLTDTFLISQVVLKFYPNELYYQLTTLILALQFKNILTTLQQFNLFVLYSFKCSSM